MKSSGSEICLKVAGIINIILGVLTFLIPAYSIFMIITGLILLCSSVENVDKYRGAFVFLAVILFAFSFISSILLLVVIGKSSENNSINGINVPPKPKVDPEIKKIDILLKLGVGMVFVSGILFATTSWDLINDLVKAIVLIILGVLFLGLSFLTEKKLKLYKTSFMYWILSMSFFLLTIVGLLYFGFFGTYLTYFGPGQYLAISITFLVGVGLLTATYLKYPKIYFLYIIYSCVLLSLCYFLVYLKVGFDIILIIVMIAVLLININSSKESSLFNFSKILSYIMFVFIFSVRDDFSVITTVVLCLFNLVNLYYLQSIVKDDFECVFNLVIIYVSFFELFINLNFLNEFKSLLMAFSLSIHTMLVKFKYIKLSENYNDFNYFLYSISMFGLGLTFFYSSTTSFFVFLIYLLVNTLFSFNIGNSHKMNYVKYIEPVAIMFTIIYLFDFSSGIAQSFVFVFLSLIYCLCNELVHSEENKKIYCVSIFVSILLSLFFNLSPMDEVSSLFVIFPSLYYFYFYYFREKGNNKKLVNISYLLLLFAIYNVLCIVDVFGLSIIISSLLFILTLIISIWLITNSSLRKIAYFGMVIPLYNIVNCLDANFIVYRKIMFSILILYVTFLILKFFSKNYDDKNVFGIIGIVFALIEVFYEPNLAIGIYIGIIGIVVMMVGFYYKELKNFFISGLIIIIINIIYQLYDLWGRIPFWLYLLLGGLGIISFVTYKELSKVNKK